jgi:hypothetical protein
MPINARLRFEVLRRDNHTCRYCGGKAPAVEITVDHVVPQALGGLDEPTNLVAACADCNAGKASIAPDAAVVEDVAEDAMRWRKAMELANAMADKEREERAGFCRQFLTFWRNWSWQDRTGETRYTDLPGNWEIRVGELMQAGLTVHDMGESVDIAMSAKYVQNEFAYFLKVAQERIATRQSVARELIRQGLVQ